MATPKYKKQFDEMLTIHKTHFEKYEKMQAAADSNSLEDTTEFEDLKQLLYRTIRKNEDKLCARSENTKYLMYSQNLADKFWELVREKFPKLGF